MINVNIWQGRRLKIDTDAFNLVDQFYFHLSWHCWVMIVDNRTESTIMKLWQRTYFKSELSFFLSIDTWHFVYSNQSDLIFRRWCWRVNYSYHLPMFQRKTTPMLMIRSINNEWNRFLFWFNASMIDGRWRSISCDIFNMVSPERHLLQYRLRQLIRLTSMLHAARWIRSSGFCLLFFVFTRQNGKDISKQKENASKVVLFFGPFFSSQLLSTINADAWSIIVVRCFSTRTNHFATIETWHYFYSLAISK